MGVTDALVALGSEPIPPLDPENPWAFRERPGEGAPQELPPSRGWPGVKGQGQRHSSGWASWVLGGSRHLQGVKLTKQGLHSDDFCVPDVQYTLGTCFLFSEQISEGQSHMPAAC